MINFLRKLGNAGQRHSSSVARPDPVAAIRAPQTSMQSGSAALRMPELPPISSRNSFDIVARYKTTEALVATLKALRAPNWRDKTARCAAAIAVKIREFVAMRTDFGFDPDAKCTFSFTRPSDAMDPETTVQQISWDAWESFLFFCGHKTEDGLREALAALEAKTRETLAADLSLIDFAIQDFERNTVRMTFRVRPTSSK